MVLVGSEEGNCTEDSLAVGSEADGVAGDLTVPTNFLANFLRGDIDLDNVLARLDPLLFPPALGGVARNPLAVWPDLEEPVSLGA